ncbi:MULTISPECIES: 5-(carboxyamino)imidazole ribonucleotide synthase [Tepidibacillus]|uniref:N5-carboxyaminoimidazole ribonucleotide synthase n=1 Tax=Tepidibacillus fermentans TaxID=1281767 RepID=A0A4R3KCH6_9BACI|nr:MULTISPECIES: 5-(carboxyamino)imidazole ribonucleotide synthase [Tepidibacillus]TCS80619.1 5-(carboxyamino)imidazole ribonucleotide synthase [Tepidibacillus fermentans]GBF10807.1 N5-carboxyaminoimidazole ribonucleotide synthase [Tepidibacillus sp. HK-1]
MGSLVLPGASIGIIGGGQLGKMLSIAAQSLGYKVTIWSEEEDCPACRVTTSAVIGKYTDKKKLLQFIELVDIATVETEHIPLDTLQEVEKSIPLYPNSNIIGTAQNRKKEKLWLKNKEFPVAPFQLITSIDDVIEFKQKHNEDIVVKTITGGYDGKGQLLITGNVLKEIEIEQIKKWLSSGNDLIAEVWLPIKAELSVIAARNKNGFIPFPVVENQHRHHILHRTIAPARLEKEVTSEAIKLTEQVMEQMDYRGLLCVEFFYDKNGHLYINELAPRPHNSGHHTLEATITSQFEQTIRAICGLPLGDTRLITPCVMTNLLGDLWHDHFKIENILKEPSTKLHLYGKKEARLKRKMGHYTTLADTLDEALAIAEKIYLSLTD